MKERGMTQVDLARETGVSQAAVSNWLNGSVPKGDQLLILTKAFGVTMDWLLTGKGPKSLGIAYFRKGLLLMAVTMASFSDKTNPEAVQLLSNAMHLLEADNLHLHQDVPPDDPFYVSLPDLIDYAERFKSADHEGKLEMLGTDRKIAERSPDILEIFERLLAEHVAAIRDPAIARLVIERADRIIENKGG